MRKYNVENYIRYKDDVEQANDEQPQGPGRQPIK